MLWPFTRSALKRRIRPYESRQGRKGGRVPEPLGVPKAVNVRQTSVVYDVQARRVNHSLWE